MRSQFKGHFGEAQESIDELWQSATFVFDANVLLNLYRYSDKARSEFLRLLTAIQERSWLPEQCAHEFLSNRAAVISAQMKSYTNTAKAIGEIKNTFAGTKGHPFISEKNFRELSSVIGKIDKELTKRGESQENRITKDDVKEKIADVFEGRIGPRFSDSELDKLFVEGDERYREKIPPGFKDQNKNVNAERRSEKRSNFGDFILWRQITDLAKNDSKDVILITDDQKADWWLVSSGKTISARPELITEFCEVSGQRILIYTTNRFLQMADEKLGAKVSEKTIDEIAQEHFSRYSINLAEERELQRKRDREIEFIRARKNARRLELETRKMEDTLRHERDYDLSDERKFHRSERRKTFFVLQDRESELKSIRQKMEAMIEIDLRNRKAGDEGNSSGIQLEMEHLKIEENFIQEQIMNLKGHLL